MERCDSLYECAKTSTSRVAAIAVKLGVERRSPFLGTLAAELTIVSKALDRPTPDQQELFRGRAEKLLVDLEKVCTWPTPVVKGTYPTLNAITTYQTTKPYKQAEIGVRRGLPAFASADPMIRQSFISNLRQFATSKRKGVDDVTEIPEQSLGRTTKALGLPNDYAGHVNECLYTALQQHSSCTCTCSGTTEGAIRQHEARLRLKGSYTEHDGFVLFDMLFSGSPAPFPPCDPCHWQHLQLRVPSKRQGLKKVKIYQDEANQSVLEPSTTAERVEPVNVGNFCELLKSRYGDVRICLKIHNGDLLRLHNAEETDQYVEAAQSVSLAQVLETYRLSTKMKIVLAYILARSVWQFYNSDWMKTRWMGESIQFMPERCLVPDIPHQQSKFYACKPCFAVHFNDSDDSFPEYCDSFSIIHRYPRVLALGSLLLDIGRRSYSVQARSQPQSVEEKINSDWITAMNAFKDDHWPDFESMANKLVRKIYKTAVMNCFDKKIFGAAALQSRKSNSGRDSGIEERRAILHERVVHPLETLLADMGWANALGNIEPMNFKVPSRAPTGMSNGELIGSSSRSGGTGGAAMPSLSEQAQLLTDPVRAAQAESEKWLDKIMKSAINRQIVAQCTKSMPKPRIKVAILDTGYDEYADFFTIAGRRNRMQGWKDWVDDSLRPEDHDGHGTHVVSLVMKIAPAADIYVARVAKNAAGLQSASKKVAEAIAWAANICKADIISMSFGFPEEVLVDGQRVISKAIEQAVGDRNYAILFFAAAANSGANQKEMFPANHDFVISIRGTNPDGVFEDFNPPPDRDGPAVFGTLGKVVPSAWLRSYDGEICKSGTSVATPIAAGIAAMVLGYATIELHKRNLPEKAKKLWTRHGMTAMFNKMSTCTRERCFYVSPGEFFAKEESERWAAMITAAADARR